MTMMQSSSNPQKNMASMNMMNSAANSAQNTKQYVVVIDDTGSGNTNNMNIASMTNRLRVGNISGSNMNNMNSMGSTYDANNMYNNVW